MQNALMNRFYEFANIGEKMEKLTQGQPYNAKIVKENLSKQRMGSSQGGKSLSFRIVQFCFVLLLIIILGSCACASGDTDDIGIPGITDKKDKVETNIKGPTLPPISVSLPATISQNSFQPADSTFRSTEYLALDDKLLLVVGSRGELDLYASDDGSLIFRHPLRADDLPELATLSNVGHMASYVVGNKGYLYALDGSDKMYRFEVTYDEGIRYLETYSSSKADQSGTKLAINSAHHIEVREIGGEPHLVVVANSSETDSEGRKISTIFLAPLDQSTGALKDSFWKVFREYNTTPFGKIGDVKFLTAGTKDFMVVAEVDEGRVNVFDVYRQADGHLNFSTLTPDTSYKKPTVETFSALDNGTDGQRHFMVISGKDSEHNDLTNASYYEFFPSGTYSFVHNESAFQAGSSLIDIRAVTYGANTHLIVLSTSAGVGQPGDLGYKNKGMVSYKFNLELVRFEEVNRILTKNFVGNHFYINTTYDFGYDGVGRIAMPTSYESGLYLFNHDPEVGTLTPQGQTGVNEPIDYRSISQIIGLQTNEQAFLILGGSNSLNMLEISSKGEIFERGTLQERGKRNNIDLNDLSMLAKGDIDGEELFFANSPDRIQAFTVHPYLEMAPNGHFSFSEESDPKNMLKDIDYANVDGNYFLFGVNRAEAVVGYKVETSETILQGSIAKKREISQLNFDSGLMPDTISSNAIITGKNKVYLFSHDGQNKTMYAHSIESSGELLPLELSSNVDKAFKTTDGADSDTTPIDGKETDPNRPASYNFDWIETAEDDQNKYVLGIDVEGRVTVMTFDEDAMGFSVVGKLDDASTLGGVTAVDTIKNNGALYVAFLSPVNDLIAIYKFVDGGKNLVQQAIFSKALYPDSKLAGVNNFTFLLLGNKKFLVASGAEDEGVSVFDLTFN